MEALEGAVSEGVVDLEKVSLGAHLDRPSVR